MAFPRSLVPQMVRPTSDWWDLWDFPPRIFDQHFGMGLTDEDLLPLTSSSPFYARSLVRNLSRQTSNKGTSEVSNAPNQFSVSLDVSQFTPNEITVKAVDNNCVVIEGKHEERPDEHGYITRSFSRRYMLPKGIDADNIVSSLSPQGVLTVAVPKKVPIEEGKPKEKVIPITIGSSPIAVDPTNPLSPASQAQPKQQEQAPAQPQQASGDKVQQPEKQTEPESPAQPVTQSAPAPAPGPEAPAAVGEPEQPKAAPAQEAESKGEPAQQAAPTEPAK